MLAGLGVLALCVRPGWAEPAPSSFKELLAAYATMPGLEAGFTEEKHLALLAQPLENRGRLFFARPGYLLRKVEAPVPATVLVTPTEIRIADDQGVKTIDLETQKDVRPFVQSLVWLLAGDHRALTEAYRTQFERDGASERWQLTLRPRAATLARLVKVMKIDGEGLTVRRIEVEETSGDKTTTRITSANPKRRFSADERARFFGERTANER